MKKRVFFWGFGISVVLLAICAMFAFSSRWEDNFVLFFAKNAGYVGSPAEFRYSYFAFLVLNLPALVVAMPCLYLLDFMFEVSGRARVIVVFVLLLISSFAWWWGAARVAEWWRRRSRTRVHPSQ